MMGQLMPRLCSPGSVGGATRITYRPSSVGNWRADPTSLPSRTTSTTPVVTPAVGLRGLSLALRLANTCVCLVGP